MTTDSTTIRRSHNALKPGFIRVVVVRTTSPVFAGTTVADYEQVGETSPIGVLLASQASVTITSPSGATETFHRSDVSDDIACW